MPKKKKKKTCAYCGKLKHCEKEHVVPSCLFVKKPLNTVTVPACTDCNRRKGVSDTDLRDYLTLDVYGEQHPTAKILQQTKLIRSVQSNRSRIWSQGEASAKVDDLVSKKGIILANNIVTMKIDGKYITDSIEFITRGLFYKATGNVLEIDAQMETQRFFVDGWNDLEKIFDPKSSNYGAVGTEYSCYYNFFGDNKEACLWLHVFYERVVFVTSIERPHLEKQKLD